MWSKKSSKWRRKILCLSSKRRHRSRETSVIRMSQSKDQPLSWCQMPRLSQLRHTEQYWGWTHLGRETKMTVIVTLTEKSFPRWRSHASVRSRTTQKSWGLRKMSSSTLSPKGIEIAWTWLWSRSDHWDKATMVWEVSSSIHRELGLRSQESSPISITTTRRHQGSTWWTSTCIWRLMKILSDCTMSSMIKLSRSSSNTWGTKWYRRFHSHPTRFTNSSKDPPYWGTRKRKPSTISD